MGTTLGALARKLFTLRRQVSFEATLRLCGLNLLEEGRPLAPQKNSAFQRPVSSLWQVVKGIKGTERSGEEEPTWQGGRGGLVTPLGGTRRDTGPQGSGIDRWQRLLGTRVDERVRA